MGEWQRQQPERVDFGCHRYIGSAVLGAGTSGMTAYTASEITGACGCAAGDPAAGPTKTVAGGKFSASI